MGSPFFTFSLVICFFEFEFYYWDTLGYKELRSKILKMKDLRLLFICLLSIQWSILCSIIASSHLQSRHVLWVSIKFIVKHNFWSQLFRLAVFVNISHKLRNWRKELIEICFKAVCCADNSDILYVDAGSLCILMV